MLHDTRGIVFQQFKYAESSIIVKVYTENFGLQSYIVKGIRSKKAKLKSALFEPLNLLDLVVYHKERKDLHHFKEVKVGFVYQSIPVDFVKRSLLFFLNELLYRSIREQTPNKRLFEWLYNALTWLDLSGGNITNYHLVFCIQLSRFLGFYPKKEPQLKTDVFDLQEGQFLNKIPEHPQYLKGSLVDLLSQLQDASFESSGNIKIDNNDRRKLLETLMMYYRLHLPGFGEMKSIEVLRSVLD